MVQVAYFFEQNFGFVKVHTDRRVACLTKMNDGAVMEYKIGRKNWNP